MKNKYRILNRIVLGKNKFKIQKKWLHLLWINCHGSFPQTFDTFEEATFKVQELIDMDHSCWVTVSSTSKDHR